MKKKVLIWITCSLDLQSVTNKKIYGRYQTKNHYRQQGAFSYQRWSADTFNLATRLRTQPSVLSQ